MESILAKALGQDASQLAAAEKRVLLARLLGRLAHEVRNPLSSLDIHVQLLEEDLASLAPQMREQLTPRLEIIHGELHRLEGIVERFLHLAGPAGQAIVPAIAVWALSNRNGAALAGKGFLRLGVLWASRCEA